jgi:long-chain acyl-CoA synthetase
MTTSVEQFAVTTSRKIGRGTPLFPDEPKTLSELFTQAAKHDRADALTYKRDGEWRRISSKQLLARIKNLAFGLYSLGLKKGDRLALLATNSPE